MACKDYFRPAAKIAELKLLLDTVRASGSQGKLGQNFDDDDDDDVVDDDDDDEEKTKTNYLH